MATNSRKIIIGMPDQGTTGAVLSGDVIPSASVPSTFEEAEALASAMTSSGFVSEEGASMSSSRSLTDIRDWSRGTQRRVVSEREVTVSATLIQTDYESLCQFFGEGNVELVAATAGHGEQIRVRVNGALPEARGWALKMKDGDARVLVIVPNGQQTGDLDITFNAGDPIELPLEISCYDDGAEGNAYIFIDDGQKAAADEGGE